MAEISIQDYMNFVQDYTNGKIKQNNFSEAFCKAFNIDNPNLLKATTTEADRIILNNHIIEPEPIEPLPEATKALMVMSPPLNTDIYVGNFTNRKFFRAVGANRNKFIMIDAGEWANTGRLKTFVRREKHTIATYTVNSSTTEFLLVFANDTYIQVANFDEIVEILISNGWTGE